MKKKITQLIQTISLSSFLIAVYGTKHNLTDTGIQNKFKCKQERNAFLIKKYENVLAKKIKEKEKLMGSPSLEIQTEFKEIKQDCDNLNNLSSDIINNNKLMDEEQIIKGEELIQKGTEFSNKLSESNDK
jgi:Holliday junction resolvase RusA-like endonuclease